jgi:PTH1 family peptidyl-tRNA hydrolase
MKLVVGLGNPGKKYENTRHNVGFELIRSLSERHAADAGKLTFEGFLQECRIGNEKTLLLTPHTFMNLSGRAIRQAVDFFKLPLEDLLVVCDDFNLPLGTLRMRPSGSDGGQKGLADTIVQLKTDQFARLRMGIGPVPDRWAPADFVLGKFSRKEREEVDELIFRAMGAVEEWVAAGVAQAMSRYNGIATKE